MEDTKSDSKRDVEHMKNRLKQLFTKDARLKGLAFVPRSTDVFIVTSPKCGTTWMQQIVHQLRSGGDMTFNDISEVTPMIELGYALGMDLEGEQRGYQPRCFNTHLCYDHCPKGGKYIVIWREPCAAFYSFFNFFKGWMFHPNDISLDEFVKEFLLTQGKPKTQLEDASYYEHLVSWWEHKSDVLFVFYEDMKEDLQKAVATVAKFIGVDDEENIKTATEMSSFDFMKENSEKFKIHQSAGFANKVLGIPDGPIPDRVLAGSTTKALEAMSNELKQAIQEKWQETVTKATGIKDYSELRNEFRWC